MFFLKSRSEHFLNDHLMLTLRDIGFTDFLDAHPDLPSAKQLKALRNKIKELGQGVRKELVYIPATNRHVPKDSFASAYSTFNRNTKTKGDALLSFVPFTSQFSARITLASKLKAIENLRKEAAPLLYKLAKSKEFTEKYGHKNGDSDSKVIHGLLATAHPRLTTKWQRNQAIAATFNEIDHQSDAAPTNNTNPVKKYVPFDPKLGNWTKMTRVPTFENSPKSEEALLTANKSLEKEYNARTEQLFDKAYETYQSRLPNYYQKYKNGEYATYINSCNQKKAEIDKLYEPKAKSARTTLILGAIFSPLVLPLIAVGIGWWRLRKVNAKKAEKLAEYHTTLAQDKWEKQNQGKLQTFDTWKATNTYSKEEFMQPTNETEEAQKAHEAHSEMRNRYVKAIDNNFKLAFNFKGRGIGAPKTIAELETKIVRSLLLPTNKATDDHSSAQIAPSSALHLAATS